MSQTSRFLSRISKNVAVVSTGVESPLSVLKELPIPKVPDNKILIKACAFAVNPLDTNFHIYGFTKKDFIMGCDVSGIVEEVGNLVSGFARGDYVSAWVRGNFSPSEGGFSNYVLAGPSTTLKYDTDKFNFVEKANSNYGLIDSFEGAASVTLSLSIIALNLSYGFNLKESDTANSDKYILVWGGASSSGIATIQLIKKIYGVKVITTASPQHHEFLTKIGADHVLDYNDSEVISKIKSIGQGNIRYALDTISNKTTFRQTYDATSDSENVTILNLLFLQPSALEIDTIRENVEFKSLSGFFALDEEVFFRGAMVRAPEDATKKYYHIWFNLLPKVLPEIYHPNLKIIGHGLESAEEAMKYVFAKKTSGEKAVFTV